MKRATKNALAVVVPAAVPAQGLKLDLGCGKNKKEGFIGVDAIKFEGVDQVVDLRKAPYPWANDSVEEAHASHFLEHLDADERIVFFNEMYRVMKPGAKMLIIVPHWSSGRAYGDLSHKWPPVVEFFWYYLSREWRAVNAPHLGLTCNFSSTGGYSIAQPWPLKNTEAQQFAINHYREVAQDMITTVVKA